jgi:sugar phosphate isomerase/epimerase
MTDFRLGINNCFAVKRWPEADRWAEIVSSRLGLDLVQHSLDLVDLSLPKHERIGDAERVARACSTTGLELHSTFTGLVAYSSNLLLDPEPSRRAAAEAWYRRAIEYSAAAGAGGTGGHVGAYSEADWKSPERRRLLDGEMHRALRRLTGAAHRAGLGVFYLENLASAREPSTMAHVQRLLAPGDPRHVPIRLCLDVGHMCVPGAEGEERDPYAWLRRFGQQAPAVHLQQTDASADHHWPFTESYNRQGRIDAAGVIDALKASGVAAVTLILEIIPSFEADDRTVLEELQASVEYWREGLATSTVRLAGEEGFEPSTF